MSDGELLLGVDGGGSKTRAIVCTLQGVVLGAGAAPSSNLNSVGMDRAKAALRSAVDAATATAGAGAPRFAAACFGVAGLNREEDRVRFEQWVVEQQFAPRVSVVNDSEIVLAAGTPDGWGMGLICGTGSIAFGRSRDGARQAQAGGWGWLMGDEGSGYAIGVAALRAATQAADGRSEARALLSGVLEAWGLASPPDLIAYGYRPEATRAEVARLASVVFRLSDAGDAHARAIVDDAAAGAALLVTTLARALGEPDAPLALAGGLLSGHAGYRTAICERAGVPAERARVVQDPAQGAIVLARRALKK